MLSKIYYLSISNPHILSIAKSTIEKKVFIHYYLYTSRLIVKKQFQINNIFNSKRFTILKLNLKKYIKLLVKP